MILNYIKIAWRNLVKQRLFSLINISGLAVGLAVCMMIMMYVTHEMSYDRFHTNADRIFSPRASIQMGGTTMGMAYMSYSAGEIIKQRQPIVKDYMRTMAYFKPVIVSNPEKPEIKFSEKNLLFADENFFRFFSFTLISGNAENVLDRPFTVVLSEDMAKRYFGDENPIGKTITLKTDSAFTYQVTGVAQNNPSNSSIEFNFVTSNQSLLKMKEASLYTGYLLCYAFKPWFLNVLQLKIDDTFLYSPSVLILLFALLLLTILIAGSYPSLVLSAFKPVATLKGKMGKSTGGVVVRKVFTTLQFSISVGLIICGIVIDRQLYFFRHADTGVNRENVVMIPVHNTFGANYPAFKQDIQALSGVESAATSHYAMFSGYDMNSFNGKTKDENIMVASLSADDQYIKTIGLKWKYAPAPGQKLAGMEQLVINEAAIGKLHLPANPIGSYVQSGDHKMKVIGVLKNFNFSSLQSEISGLVLYIAPANLPFFTRDGCNLFARIKPHTNLPTLLGKMQAIYKKYDKDTPFNYTFMDDAFNAQYKAEDRLASIFSVFTYITIILATLGLFGLAAFTIEQRTKEIGVRKVLGASLVSINTLLSRDFLTLVILSIAIASPIAWWAMHKWLQGFAYRITISWWMFAAAGFVAIITAIVTVSYHAIKAGIANPVESLRSE